MPTAIETASSVWAEVLAGALPVLQPPSDLPRPQQLTSPLAGTPVPFLREYAAQLMEPEGPIGARPPLLAAFAVWLHRMTFEKEVVVGVVTEQGSRLPLRVDLAGAEGASAPTFGAVKAATEQSLQAAESWIGLDQSAVLAAARDRLSSKQRRVDESADVQGFKVEYLIGDAKQSAGCELALRVRRNCSVVQCELLFSPHLASAAFSKALAENFALLVASALADPSRSVGSYSLITPAGRSVLPDPTTSQDEGWTGSIVDAFQTAAAANPGNTAVEYEGGFTLTYKELDESSSQLARLLVNKGVVLGDVIGLYGHRSPAVVVAILACYKAGAAYSMMDPQYPASRVITCMEIAGISGWLRVGEAPAEPEDLEKFLGGKGLKARVHVPQPKAPEFAQLVKGLPVSAPGVRLLPDSTSVVTFTSGSTGTPKGVLGRHSALTTFYPWMGSTFNLGVEDRFGMCSGIAHDPLQRDVFTPLFFGASIYIPAQSTIDTPGKLARWMKEKEISVLCLTPALGQILVTVDDPSFKMPKLRFVKFVGDMLIKRDVIRLQTIAPTCRIINMWGTTETSRAVGYFNVPPPPAGGSDFMAGLKEVIPVGKGMKDAQMLLLNAEGQLAGIGEAAEIYMRSPHIAKGYVGLPEESAAKFLQSPFTKNPADRLYRSGDLGHYLADGTVECLGRADDQVKIRGFRIELGEINAKLSRHPSCKENVTVVRTDSGEKQIVSYVVPQSGYSAALQDPEKARALTKEIREFLKGCVPVYMVPSVVVLLSEMPLTPNMKINTRALPSPASADEGPGLDESTLSETERKILQVWSKHLKARVPSREESFFDLGGHSLVATLVTMDVMKVFDITLPLNVIFANPTLAAFGKAVEEVKAGGVAGGAKALDLLPEAEIEFKRLPTHQDPPVKPRASFLTGSSGFLGSFILRDLLELTEGPVYCLVWNLEAKDSEGALKRVEQIMRNTQTWKDEFRARLRPCLGDLGTPSFGFTPEVWKELTQEVDLVVHCGAFVHWLFDYHKLKPANVEATRECLRLCAEGRLKQLAFVSTTNCYEADYAANPTIKEDQRWEGLGKYTTGTLTGGYTQSKWVADKMVMNAADRGMPASSMRPSYISADSHSGVWGTDDFLVRLMKGCVQLKAFPTINPNAGIDMTPVDYMARAIVRLSLQPSLRGKHFNLVNPKPVPYAAVFKFLQQSGFELEELSFGAWRQRLHDAVAAGEDNALAAIIAQFTEGWADGLRTRQAHDCAQVTKGMEGHEAFPDVEPTLIAALTYFVACGFLPAPPGGLRRKGPVDWDSLFASEQVSCITRFRAPQKK
eukprot:Hpha_TRINITY_DN13208_c0_g1::TRINITY_DN13208_c0_g1_i1::g.155002::m.155002/K00143/LYS2; L-2-aminoadipate reductase